MRTKPSRYLLSHGSVYVVVAPASDEDRATTLTRCRPHQTSPSNYRRQQSLHSGPTDSIGRSALDDGAMTGELAASLSTVLADLESELTLAGSDS